MGAVWDPNGISNGDLEFYMGLFTDVGPFSDRFGTDLGPQVRIVDSSMGLALNLKLKMQ